ncbi:hypothetical protein C8R48DRAFT_771766 [Suillus tomentosus]|nr:hypothetical protein C8R48DRAFT_771766 [Suillus tomentosus]
MPQPATCPGNANKHPGQVVLDVNRVVRPKEVIAAEKKKASAEKSAKATALDNAQKQVAAKEDAMAVEQMAQCAGPGPLVRPKPKLRPATKAVTVPTANLNKTPVGTSPASQDTNTQRKKYPGLKLTFKDGVNASRKVSDNGVASLSETRVGSPVDDGKFWKLLGSESSKLAEGAGVGKWARGVASKSQVKPSAPPSARASVIANNDAEGFEDDDPPEDHDDSVPTSWGGPGVVHISQTAVALELALGSYSAISRITPNYQALLYLYTADYAPRGRKCGLSTALLDDLKPKEQCEMEEDQDADEDVQEDVDMTDQQGDIEVCEVSNSRLTTSMSISVMETATDNQTPKYIKTENGCAPLRLNQKRVKPKNLHLPSGAQNSTFRSIFIPTVIHWVGNSQYPCTIPEQKFSDILDDISLAVYPTAGNFQYDDGCNLAFTLVSQRISEWRGNFGSTAISILMTFFASTDEYDTKEARKAYTEYQLEDSRFVYEDPDSEDSPGAFLSEFILCIFAVQLNATQGHQIIDSLDFELPGYATALALTTAAMSCASPLQKLLIYHLQAERALILARDDLTVEDTSDQGKHKVMLTLNHADTHQTWFVHGHGYFSSLKFPILLYEITVNFLHYLKILFD